MKVEVYELFESLDNPKPVTLSGTLDGYKLAMKCEKNYSPNHDFELNFENVLSMSGSAVCAFWDYLQDHIGVESIKTMKFTNLNGMLLDELKRGYEYSIGPLTKPA